MITLKELTKGKAVPEEYQGNIKKLLKVMNVLREIHGKPMIITSGFRTMEDHLRIYSNRSTPAPLGSFHLKGAACDVYDPDGSLMSWIRANETLLETIGLWVEDDPSQPRVHFQIYAPKSGNRFFKP